MTLTAKQVDRVVAAFEKAATALQKMAKIEAERFSRDFPEKKDLDAQISKVGEEEPPQDEGEPIATGRFRKLFDDSQKPSP